MTMTQTDQTTAAETTAFSITPAAAKRITVVVGGEVPGTAMRVAVNGGGCSGFQYDFSLDSQRTDEDIVIERDGATVLVDDVSMDLLAGSVLDYVTELGGAYFKIANPNATASCGCGASFSV